MKERKWNHGYDIFHIICGSFVVVFTIIAVLKPKESYYAYSAVFLWAGLMALNMAFYWWNCQKTRTSYQIEGGIFVGIAVILLVLAAASIITNWS
ncbi:MAG: hypothetical protein MSG78_05470 [Clostridiales bacterium]|nr:hypothetical protein [Clostridiales bacterium]